MGGAATEIIGLFFVGWITARQLGPQGKGEYTAIITWVLVIAWVASVGLRDSVAFFQSRNPERSPEIFTTSLLYTVVLAAIGIGVAQLLAPLAFRAQSDDVIAIARVAFFGIFLIVAFQTAEGLLSGQHRFALLSGIQAFSSVGAAVIMGLFALFGGLSVGNALIGKLGIYVLCAGRCTRRRARPGSARAAVAAIGARHVRVRLQAHVRGARTAGHDAARPRHPAGRARRDRDRLLRRRHQHGHGDLPDLRAPRPDRPPGRALAATPPARSRSSHGSCAAYWSAEHSPRSLSP